MFSCSSLFLKGNFNIVFQIPVKKPIFIIGMPRTGTTLLSRLMGEDPRLRAPLMWEMGSPCPPGKVENFREDIRFKRTDMRRRELFIYFSILLDPTNYTRQQSLGKGMFLHLSVILFTEGRGLASQHASQIT